MICYLSVFTFVEITIEMRHMIWETNWCRGIARVKTQQNKKSKQPRCINNILFSYRSTSICWLYRSLENKYRDRVYFEFFFIRVVHIPAPFWHSLFPRPNGNKPSAVVYLYEAKQWVYHSFIRFLHNGNIAINFFSNVWNVLALHLFIPWCL